MARYIDADRTHQFVEDNFKGDVPYEWAWTLTAIDKEPTADVVSVVRCKDCKHAYINSFSAQSGIALCKLLTNRANGDQVIMQQDDYCSYGERKN